jgi:hypothetical protein
LDIVAASQKLIHIKARFSISSKESWDELDGKFSYKEFYYRCIMTIYDFSAEERDTFFSQWNKQVFFLLHDSLTHLNLFFRSVFGNTHGRESVLDQDDDSDDGSDDDMAFMKAQREAKRIAKATIPTPPAETPPPPKDLVSLEHETPNAVLAKQPQVDTFPMCSESSLSEVEDPETPIVQPKPKIKVIGKGKAKGAGKRSADDPDASLSTQPPITKKRKTRHTKG